MTGQTGLIILAAGGSRRMGKPKQQLLYQGKTLLSHSISVALASPCRPIVVVTGANIFAIEPGDNQDAVQLVHNDQWQTGMASSIRCGMSHIRTLQTGLFAVVFMLCDQPKVTPDLLEQLIERHESKQAKLVACEYSGTICVPALFDRLYFDELAGLSGDQGAKKVLLAHRGEMQTVLFPAGAVDIDTPEEYNSLSSEICSDRDEEQIFGN
jgi:molybdenum cofactor cytidylyltransferase